MKRIVMLALLVVMTTAVLSFATWPDPAPSSTDKNVVDQHRYDKPLLYGLLVGASMFLIGFVGMWALSTFPTPSRLAMGLVISGGILMLMSIMTAICTIAAS